MNTTTRSIVGTAVAALVSVSTLFSAATPASAAATYGSGSLTAQCGDGLHVKAVEEPWAGAPNQGLYVELSVYSYNAGKWYTKYSGPGQYRDIFGRTTTLLDFNAGELNRGQYAVYATFYWSTTAGWRSASTYAGYTSWSSVYFRYESSRNCYVTG